MSWGGEEGWEQAAGEFVVNREEGEAGETAAAGFGDLQRGGDGIELAFVSAAAETGTSLSAGAAARHAASALKSSGLSV